METINKLVKLLWAKSNPYKSLRQHMVEVGETAGALLRNSIYSTILHELSEQLGLSEDDTVRTVCYIASLHDIGKCHPDFQKSDPHIAEFIAENELKAEPSLISGFRHEKYSAVITERILKNERKYAKPEKDLICRVVILHHQGKEGVNYYDRLTDLTRHKPWIDAQNAIEEELYNFYKPAVFKLNGAHADSVGMLLTGIIIFADWIASGEFFFNEPALDNINDIARNAQKRAQDFILHSGYSLGDKIECDNIYDLWEWMNPSDLRPLQSSINDYFAHEPRKDIAAVIIEAPMGEGKTEAGLYSAIRMGNDLGKQGIYVALPTAATANQMYTRVAQVLDENGVGKVRLLHSTAALSDIATAKEKIDTEDGRIALSWTTPIKRGLLSPNAVGTIDQAMMAALAIKYGVLRLLGLATKVLIIDEIHAYDTYMSEIIFTLLKWCRALKIPVVMLSATLPTDKYKDMLAIYDCKNEVKRPYPCVTIIKNDQSMDLLNVGDTFMKMKLICTIHFEKADDYDYINELAFSKVEEGGCLCLLVNTVQRAQTLYRLLKEKNNKDCEIILFHARFSVKLRQETENRCLRLFGKDKSERPVKAILVATQVVEQSLDLDFDAMITDIAPIDLILQRAGRVHRHRNTQRPCKLKEASVDVLTAPPGAFSIYQQVLIDLTANVLAQKDTISLPEDIPTLVSLVYDNIDQADFQRQMEYRFEEDMKKSEASIVRLHDPSPKGFMLGRGRETLTFDDSENAFSFLSAKTRDGEVTVSIALLNCELYNIIKSSIKLSNELLRHVFSESVSITLKSVSELINENEQLFYKCDGLLNGTYILPSEDGRCVFEDGSLIEMDREIGLIIERKKK